MTLALIICGACGHQADLDDFCRTAIGGELPKHTYQCPACSRAFQVRVTAPGTRYPSGLYVPAPLQVVEVDGRL